MTTESGIFHRWIGLGLIMFVMIGSFAGCATGSESEGSETEAAEAVEEGEEGEEVGTVASAYPSSCTSVCAVWVTYSTSGCKVYQKRKCRRPSGTTSYCNYVYYYQYRTLYHLCGY